MKMGNSRTWRTGTTFVLALLLAQCVPVIAAESEGNGGISRRETGSLVRMTREERSFATSAVLAGVFTTNQTEVARLMSPAARKDWLSFCRRMIIDGKQYFLPDFQTVKYTFIGGADEASFAVGFYNPFYDAFMLLKVNDRERIPVIESFRVATVSRLRGQEKIPAFLLAMGMASDEGYLAALAEQIRVAEKAFNSHFLGSGAPTRLTEFTSSPEGEIENLVTIQKARLGYFSLIGTEEAVRASAVLADLVVHDPRFATKAYVRSDGATKKVGEALGLLPPEMRKSLRLVLYFQIDEASNFLYVLPMSPTTLFQVNVDKGTVWMKMFDAHLVHDKKLGLR